MNKELTPLEALNWLKNVLVEQTYDFLREPINDRLHSLETALKENEEYKSRENNVLPNDEFIGDLGEHTRDEVAMKLKAFDIIKEKKVDVLAIITNACETCEEYNKEHNLVLDKRQGIKPLTQEEYELLKEELL